MEVIKSNLSIRWTKWKVESYDGSFLKGIGSEIYVDVCKTWVEVNSDLFAGDLWKWKSITVKLVT